MKLWLYVALWATTAHAQSPNPELVVQSGHRTAPTALAFAPNGMLLSGDGAGQMKMWRATAGELLCSWNMGAGLPATAWSRDGHLYATAGGNRLSVWENGATAPLWEWPGMVQSVAFAPDADTLVALGADDIVYLWNARSGELRQSFAAGESGFGRLACGPRGVVAVSYGKGFIRLYHAQSGVLRREFFLAPFSGAISQTFSTALSLSADGRTLMAAQANGNVSFEAPSGGRKCRIAIWDVPTGALQRIIEVRDGSGAVAMSPDGTRLVAALLAPLPKSQNGEARLRFYNARSGAQTREIKLEGLTVTALSYSADGAQLALAQGDWQRSGDLSLLDARSGTVRRRIAPARTLAPLQFLPNGLLSSDERGALHFWKVPGANLEYSSPPRASWWAQVVALPDGRILAARAVDEEIIISEARSGRLLWTAPGAPEGWLLSAVPGGARLVLPRLERKTGGNSGFLDIYDALSGRKAKTLERVGILGATALSRDGKTLTLVDDNLAVKTYDVAARRVLHSVELDVEGDYIHGSQLSPDGSLWVGAGEDKGRRFVQVCDTRSGKNLLRLHGSREQGVHWAFNATGDRLALGTTDGTLRLWHRNANSEPPMVAVPGGIAGLRLSDDGRLIAVGGADGALRLYDVQSLTLRVTLQLLGAKQWIGFTSAGFYHSSPAAASFLRWRVGNALFPLEKFKAQFHRPEKLPQSLRGEAP